MVIGGGTALNAASQITAAGTNAGSNQLAARNLFTFEDHVSLTHGIHRIDAGFWAQRIQANDDLAQDQYGQASFSSLTTFLQGTIGTFTVVPQSTPLGWRSTELAGFVQDAIKLRPNLEVTVGLRIEGTNGMNEAHGRASNYLFDQNGTIETQPHVGSSVFTTNNAKFLPEPRIGIAWDPFGHQKTVIHAGFGLYHALLDNLSYRLDQNAPFNTTLAIKKNPSGGIERTCIARGRVSLAQRDPTERQHPNGRILHTAYRAAAHQEFIVGRRLRWLARLPRNHFHRRQPAHPDVHQRQYLLSSRLAVGKSASREHSPHLVVQRR